MAISKSFWEAEINDYNIHIKVVSFYEIIRKIFLKTLEHLYNFLLYLMNGMVLIIFSGRMI